MRKAEKILRAAAVLLIVFCLLLSSSATPARADSEGAGTVTASALNLRREPSTASEVLVCAPRGAAVVVTGRQEDWVQVAYRGFSGYMSAEYLTITDTLDASFGEGTVTGNAVNLRTGPGTDYSIVGSRSKGDTLRVIGVAGSWYKVDLGGSAAYIKSTYLSLASGSAGSGQGAASSSVSAASGTGTINGIDVRVRSGPSTSHSILDTVSTGTTMTVTGEEGSWYRVNYNGVEGYVYRTYLSLGASSSGASGTQVTDMAETAATVISPVHLRTGPDASYTSLRVLDTGASVTITGQTEKWYRVNAGGTDGYVFKTYLTTGGSVSGDGSRIVAMAREYLGVPYVYGGTSPSGFDCSGLVYYVYRQCGYSITRTATAQSRDGVQVARSAMQPGDIIIFYNSAMTAIGHSGIYIGDNQFIHASSSGGRVMISSLTNYYDTHFCCARRVV